MPRRDPRTPETSDFSRLLAVDDLAETTDLSIEANPAERQALASRLGVLSVEALGAELRVVREMGAMVHLSGRLSVDVVQSCVVTLEPLTSHIEVAIDRRFGPPAAIAGADGDEDLDPEDDGPPDPLVDGVLDVGAALAEALALEIDPFPRAEGAEFAGYSSDSGSAEPADNPFAVLKSLFKKPE